MELSSRDKAIYIVKFNGEELLLTKKGSEVPLFQQQKDTSNFISCVETVAKWWSVLEMDNPNTEISRNEVNVAVSVLEGQAINSKNIDEVAPSETLLDPPSFQLKYKPESGKTGQPELYLPPGMPFAC